MEECEHGPAKSKCPFCCDRTKISSPHSPRPALKPGLGGCPVCGGNDLARMTPITSGLTSPEDAFVYQEIECENCGAWFEVVYSFLHIRSIHPKSA